MASPLHSQTNLLGISHLGAFVPHQSDFFPTGDVAQMVILDRLLDIGDGEGHYMEPATLARAGEVDN
jgi:hypothetical protein